MYPTISKRILNLIDEHHLTSLTVDIFDTILLRAYWPAKLRRYDLARQWLPALQNTFSTTFTAHEIHNAYTYAAHQVKSSRHTHRLDLDLDVMIEYLSFKYNLQLTSDDKFQLLVQLIRTALEFEIANTHVNTDLLDQLTEIKQLHPELKLYFLTDNRFGIGQIRTLLDIKNIHIFDGGACSSDLSASKHTGEIFDKLSAEFDSDFDLTKNLHIGDERHSDFVMPTAHGSFALHYRPLRFRGLRTLIGKSTLLTYETLAHRREHQRLRALLESNANTPNLWQYYGLLLALTDRTLAAQIHLRSELDHKPQYLLCGPHSTEIYQHLSGDDNLRLATSLNIATIFRAFTWLLATFQTNSWNAPRLLALVAKATGLTSRLDIYRLCLGDHPVSALALASLTDDEFYTYILSEIRNSDESLTAPLRSAYDFAVSLLPADQAPLCLVSLSDNTNLASLFHEFIRLHGLSNEITSWALDPQGIISTSESTLTNRLTDRTSAKIAKGGTFASATLSISELSPETYLPLLASELKHLTKLLK